MKKFTLVLFTLLTLLPLGAWADETVDNVTYSISGSNATVTSVANVASVTIPTTVTISATKYTVTGIQNGAFNSCTALEDIAIEGTTFYELSNHAFQSLPTTLAIVFNGIKYKHQGDTWYNGDYFKVLSHTDGVTSYNILESINGIAVTEIAANAFGDISGKSVTISKNITTISNTAFIHFTNGGAQNANNLSDITVAAENTKYFSHNGALYSQDGNEKVLITCPTSKSSNTNIWADGITTIGANAFFCNRNLSSITIPATVKTIEQSAFQYAGLDVASLSVIFSGNQLTTIGTSAFQNSGLTSISLPEGLTKIEISAFNSNAKLTSVSLPASLTTLGASAFRDCNLLETVTFTEGIVLSAIPSHAFNKCKLTSELIIPEGVTTIGNWAFSNKNSENDGSPAISNLSIVKIPSTISSIASNAFPAGVTKKYKLNLELATGQEWATYYSIEDLALPTGLKAYAVDLDPQDETKLTIDELQYIHKNEAILLQRTSDPLGDFWCTAPTTDAKTADAGKSSNSDIFKGSTTGVNLTTVTGDKYVLNGDEFVKANYGTLDPYRCYLLLTNADNPSKITFADTGITVGDKNSFIYKEDGTVIQKDNTKGYASLEKDGDMMKLTVTPGTSGNYYAYKSDITVRRNVTAASGRAPSLDNTTYTLSIVGENQNPDPSGTIVYTFNPAGASVFEVTVNFHKRTNLSDNVSREINPTPTNYTYDGTEKTQTVTSVTFGDQTITPENFDVSYTNNTNAGSATITITGKRECKGTYSESFTIAKRNINNITVNEKLLEGCAEDQRLTKTFTGSAITLTAEELGISDLKPGTTEQAITTDDYNVTYENNTNVSTSTQKARINIVSRTANGVNYQSTKVLYFTIVPKVMTGENVADIPDQPWKGSAIEPALTITYLDNAFIEGTDYDVVYTDKVNSGIATATITFKGNYSGEVVKHYNILDHDQTISVTFDNPDNQWTTYYSKENLKLVEGLKAYIVTNLNGLELETSEVGFIPRDTPVLLYSESGTHSFDLTTDYSATTDIQSYDAFKGTLTDMEAFPSTTVRRFVLVNGQFVQAKEGMLAAHRCYLELAEDAVPSSVTKLDFTKAGSTIIYQQDGATPTGSIGTASTQTASDGKVTLTVKPKRGYYVNPDDIKVVKNAAATSARAPKVDEGLVPYTAENPTENEDYSSTYLFTYQSEANCQYQITVNFHQATSIQTSGQQAKVTFAKTVWNGQEQKTKPTVTTFDDKPMTENVDYVLSYDGNDYTNAGTKSMKVIGIRKYTSDLTKTFEIEKRPLSSISVKALEGQTWKVALDKENPQVVYTGSDIKLDIADIVKIGEQDVDLRTNDEATITYSADIKNVGKPSVTIESKGTNYETGKRVINYEIVAKEMTANDIAAIPDQTYNGSELKPALTIKYGDIPLTDKTDYDVVYTYNIKAGEATATVNFKGNYSGKVVKKFKIVEDDATFTVAFDSNNEWTTYYADKNLSITEELEAFVITGLNGKEVNPVSIGFIPKETAVLLHRKSGEATEFKVKTCSDKTIPAEVKPSSNFKGTLTAKNISAADGRIFVLQNGQFVQTATGQLPANRCYLIVTDNIEDVTTLNIGKGVSQIICLEEGTESSDGGIAILSSTPDESKNLTLTVRPNNGWYADKENIKVVRSIDAKDARAPQMDGGIIELTAVEGYDDTSKEFKYTLPYTEGSYYQVTVDFHKCVNFQTQGTKPTITLDDTKCVYDGTEQKPTIKSVTITLNGETKALEEGKDFKADYSDNINAGTGKAVITGMNHYYNTYDGKFTIHQRDINLVKVEKIADQIYTGSKLEPIVEVGDFVTIDGKEVDLLDQVRDKEGQILPDFKIEFTNNVNAGEGTAKVAIIANKINYTGIKSGITFNILPKDMDLETNKPTIDAIGNQYYTGEPVEPKLTIHDGELLIPEDNYDIKYENNVLETEVSGGDAIANVTFKGNYKGTAQAKFQIVFKSETKALNANFGDNEWITYYSPIDINMEGVEGLEVFVVTGLNDGQGIDLKTEKVTFIPKNVGVLLHRTDKTKTSFTGETMPSRTKLEGVTPDENLFRGTTTGIEDMKTIEGVKYILLNDQFVQVVDGPLAANSCYVYLSEETADEKGIKHIDGEDANGVVIQEEGESSKTAGKVSVELRGDGYKHITVNPASVNFATIAEIKVVRSIKNESQESSRNRAPGAESELVEVLLENPSTNEDPSGPTHYKFMYDSKYNYQVTVNFKKRTALNAADVKITLKSADIANLQYDGKAKTPAVESVTCNGVKLNTDEYEVTYSNNTNAGTSPRVTITGKRIYRESTHTTFSIAKRNFSNVTVKEPIPDQDYNNGAPIVFKGLVLEDMVDGKNIVQEGDYTIHCTYTEIGEAKVSFMPANNYEGSGTKEYTFNIVAPTGINQIMVNELEGQWFDLTGQRLQNKPTQKGVYILRTKDRKTIKVRIK